MTSEDKGRNGRVSFICDDVVKVYSHSCHDQVPFYHVKLRDGRKIVTDDENRIGEDLRRAYWTKVAARARASGDDKGSTEPYPVDKVVDYSHNEDGELIYLLKWVGWDVNQDDWYVASDEMFAGEDWKWLHAQYEALREEKRRKSKRRKSRREPFVAPKEEGKRGRPHKSEKDYEGKVNKAVKREKEEIPGPSKENSNRGSSDEEERSESTSSSKTYTGLNGGYWSVDSGRRAKTESPYVEKKRKSTGERVPQRSDAVVKEEEAYDDRKMEVSPSRSSGGSRHTGLDGDYWSVSDPNTQTITRQKKMEFEIPLEIISPPADKRTVKDTRKAKKQSVLDSDSDEEYQAFLNATREKKESSSSESEDTTGYTGLNGEYWSIDQKRNKPERKITKWVSSSEDERPRKRDTSEQREKKKTKRNIRDLGAEMESSPAPERLKGNGIELNRGSTEKKRRKIESDRRKKWTSSSEDDLPLKKDKRERSEEKRKKRAGDAVNRRDLEDEEESSSDSTGLNGEYWNKEDKRKKTDRRGPLDWMEILSSSSEEDDQPIRKKEYREHGDKRTMERKGEVVNRSDLERVMKAAEKSRVARPKDIDNRRAEVPRHSAPGESLFSLRHPPRPTITPHFTIPRKPLVPTSEQSAGSVAQRSAPSHHLPISPTRHLQQPPLRHSSPLHSSTAAPRTNAQPPGRKDPPRPIPVPKGLPPSHDPLADIMGAMDEQARSFSNPFPVEKPTNVEGRKRYQEMLQKNREEAERKKKKEAEWRERMRSVPSYTLKPPPPAPVIPPPPPPPELNLRLREGEGPSSPEKSRPTYTVYKIREDPRLGPDAALLPSRLLLPPPNRSAPAKVLKREIFSDDDDEEEEEERPESPQPGPSVSLPRPVVDEPPQYEPLDDDERGSRPSSPAINNLNPPRLPARPVIPPPPLQSVIRNPMLKPGGAVPFHGLASSVSHRPPLPVPPPNFSIPPPVPLRSVGLPAAHQGHPPIMFPFPPPPLYPIPPPSRLLFPPPPVPPYFPLPPPQLIDIVRPPHLVERSQRLEAREKVMEDNNPKKDENIQSDLVSSSQEGPVPVEVEKGTATSRQPISDDDNDGMEEVESDDDTMRGLRIVENDED